MEHILIHQSLFVRIKHSDELNVWWIKRSQLYYINQNLPELGRGQGFPKTSINSQVWIYLVLREKLSICSWHKSIKKSVWWFRWGFLEKIFWPPGKNTCMLNCSLFLNSWICQNHFYKYSQVCLATCQDFI